MIYEKIQKISSGSYDLNKWLYGGYEKGVITMFAGPPASGKTNFVLLSACSMARKGKKVIFIDTEGGFSSERAKQILGNENISFLENILILNATNFQEQKKIFETLLNKIKKQDVSLIIVDGIAMLYRLEIGEAINLKDDNKIKEINREVSKQMRILSEISRKQNLPILITNQVYYDFIPESDFKKKEINQANFVGGDLFKYWSKTIIEIKNINGKRKAILLKHRSMPLKEISFEIREKGIFKKRWI